MGKVLIMRKGEIHTTPKPILPLGYTKLEYIESNGTQYIDSGIIGKSGIEVYTDWMYKDISGSPAVIGSLSSSKVRIYPVAIDSSLWGYGYNAYVSGSVEVKVNIKYSIYSKLYAGEQKLVVDGVTSASASDSGSYDTNLNMYIFALNNSGSAITPSSAKLYSMKIYDNGTLVRDFIPCINPDGEIGLYDIVTKAFFSNSGTGTFVGGNE